MFNLKFSCWSKSCKKIKKKKKTVPYNEIYKNKLKLCVITLVRKMTK